MTLFLPATVPARDANGNAQSGATWEFFRRYTTTPQTVEGAVSSVTADGNGDFAIIDLTAGVSYSAKLKTSAGRVLYHIESYEIDLFAAGVQAALDAQDKPVAGAFWRFYTTGTTTPQPVYADPDNTTALGSAVDADANGVFPQIYLDSAITYKAVLEDPDGTQLGSIDPVNTINMLLYLDPDADTSSLSQTYGALSRAQEGAGINVGSATSITSGDPSGHWQISNGRLYPSSTGDTADMNAGPYELVFDNGEQLTVTIEANTWDVATQAEWDVIAMQSAATLAGKKIALRNDSTLTLGITGATSTPFRRADFRDGSTPCTVKGRFGAAGAFADYCEVDKIQQLRGARGVKFTHLKFSAVAEDKIQLTGEAANLLEDITIDDCWISGVTADPNGDYSTSTNYPNLNDDMILSSSSAANSVGNLTITNNLIEWCHTAIAASANRDGATTTITGNEIRYFYEDAIKVPVATTGNNASAVVSDNFIHDPIGLPTDSAAQHPDALQLTGLPTVTNDWTGITIERNIILEGTSRGVMQGIFLDDMKTGAGDSGYFFSPTIRNNIVCTTGAAQGIWVGQAKNAVVDNNTVVSYGASNTLTMSLLVGTGFVNATTGGGNATTDNIADDILTVGGETATNNFDAGRAGADIAYSTLFDGPTFAPNTIAEAKALLNPKVAAGAVIP